MPLIFDEGKKVEFGEKLEDAERILGCAAIDDLSYTARKGVDKIIRTQDVSLEFDSGKFNCFQLGNNFRFIHPLTPFPDDWKNLVPIEEKRIVKGISRENFLSYVSAWQERAQTFGAQCVERGDLEAHQYSVCVKRDRLIDAVHIAMGPSRRTRRGGIWSDGWHAFFGITATPEGIPSYTGVLYSLSGFRDEFNTRGK